MNGWPAKAKLKIVFDTNVYISAFLKSGFSRELFDLVLSDKIDLFISASILTELATKLRMKFKVSEPDIQLFTTTVCRLSKKVIPRRKLAVVKVDPTDNIILECALAAGAHLIISNDKHLLRLKHYQKIGIVHPKTLVWTLPDN